ncbi:uncharacterized protein N7469_011236 [Penicillium citrinum]|uniref:Uncharacterized protein n=1 Tax=Penicillium citrinum TaxID=5077 RepID=A0A9W9TCL6_PENCI|nr:uncharacterized protein N7469_011236 [Penicillium citrinum]KAJ5217611.1 hypothetical protein N7469_011236 [Penicillium citrinum]
MEQESIVHHQENTRNPEYNAGQIHGIGVWNAFSLEQVTLEFGNVLENSHIAAEPILHTPPRPVNSQAAMRARVHCYVTNQLSRALRTAFNFFGPNDHPHLTTVQFDVGSLARTPRRFTPTLAVFSAAMPDTVRPNRVPGLIKSSAQWSSGMIKNPLETVHITTFAKVNFDMRQHQTRYSFILTDRELVAVRRLDGYGNLELSHPVPWTAHGTADHPRMTILLALWYICLLAADEQGWRLA